VGVAFESAVQQQDADTVCGLLTEQAAHELANTSASCSEGVADLDLPESGPWVRTELFGREARVEFEDDSVFVTNTAQGWRVAAAGCQEQQDDTFDCLVQGG
jgi:hypothetical protein